jgi:hypothetical protein
MDLPDRAIVLRSRSTVHLMRFCLLGMLLSVNILALSGCGIGGVPISNSIGVDASAGDPVHVRSVDVHVESLTILDTPQEDILQGLVFMGSDIVALTGHWPILEPGQFAHPEKMSLSSFNLTADLQWTKDFKLSSTLASVWRPWDSNYSFTATAERMWVGGFAIRETDLGLGPIGTSNPYILGFTPGGGLEYQQVRSSWSSSIQQLHGRDGLLAVRKWVNIGGFYRMGFELMTEGGQEIWARSESDPGMSGFPDFYDMVLDRSGELTAAGSIFGEGTWDGADLSTPGFWGGPVAIRFHADGRPRWTAKAELLNGDLSGGFYQIRATPEGDILLITVFEGQGTVRFGDAEFDIDRPRGTGKGDFFLVELSPEGEFLRTRRLDVPRLEDVIVLGGQVYVSVREYQTLRPDDDGPLVSCVRWWMHKLEEDGSLRKVLQPTGPACGEQPTWKADIRMVDLGDGRIAVGGTFSGEVTIGDRTVSTGRDDQAVYLAILKLQP